MFSLEKRNLEWCRDGRWRESGMEHTAAFNVGRVLIWTRNRLAL